MTNLSTEKVWQLKPKEVREVLDKEFFSPISISKKKIFFHAPSFMHYKSSLDEDRDRYFITISITGQGCSLKCKHCNGKVLQTMFPATTPENLFDLCKKLELGGTRGCLISGGCLPDGSVPLEKFLDSIKKIKTELKFTVFVHTGIINSYTSNKLKEIGVNAALIDVIGSDETIKEIHNLNIKTCDYEKSLKALHDSGIKYVPHVIVGLHNGKLKGELHALEMISHYEPSALVVIAFMPIRGTDMVDIKPPKPENIAEVIMAARLMFPKTPISLGCMRPKGLHRIKTDILAIKSGVDAIAFPSEEAVKFAERQRYNIIYSSFCCCHFK